MPNLNDVVSVGVEHPTKDVVREEAELIISDGIVRVETRHCDGEFRHQSMERISAAKPPGTTPDAWNASAPQVHQVFDNPEAPGNINGFGVDGQRIDTQFHDLEGGFRILTTRELDCRVRDVYARCFDASRPKRSNQPSGPASDRYEFPETDRVLLDQPRQ